MVQIDLKSPTVLPEQKIWRLFPGDGYKFLTSFLEQKVGFLDLPGFELPTSPLKEANDIIPRIAQSAKVKELLYNNDLGMISNLKLTDFSASRSTQKRGRIRRSLINFLVDAKIGDLIVLPQPIYMSDIWIGQFADDRVIEGFYPNRYGNFPIPARNVKWIGRYKENTISSNLSGSLRNQHPFTLLEQSLYVEVFSLAFSSFVYGDTHVSTVFNSEDFLDADNSFLGAISRLSSAASAVVLGERGRLDQSEILSVLLDTPPLHFTCAQEADIHSPGFTRWICATIVSLVAAALIAAFTHLGRVADSPQSLQAEIQKLEIVNLSPGADHDTTRKVSEAAKLVLESFEIDTTWRLCKSCRAANDRAGLRSSAGRR